VPEFDSVIYHRRILLRKFHSVLPTLRYGRTEDTEVTEKIFYVNGSCLLYFKLYIA